MRYKVTLPALGDEEDAALGGTITGWIAEIGEHVEEDDDLLELTTDKAAFVVPCPKSGVILEQCVVEDDVVQVDDLLCIIEMEDEDT
jgi:2-oxoglutarate dehydrogenase E2 component (dihydrolipoamide succinyltransferase)